MPAELARSILLVVVVAATILPLRAFADDLVERQHLQHSLDTACKVFAGDEDQRWAQADNCRRAWFKTHEEAIWRLKLSPHAHRVQPPSS